MIHFKLLVNLANLSLFRKYLAGYQYVKFLRSGHLVHSLFWSLYITTFKTLPVNWDHIDPYSLQSYLLIFVAAISNSVHLCQLYPIINEREQCDITAYKVCKFCASFIDIMNKILMLQCVCKKDLIFSNINWL